MTKQFLKRDRFHEKVVKSIFMEKRIVQKVLISNRPPTMHHRIETFLYLLFFFLQNIECFFVNSRTGWSSAWCTFSFDVDSFLTLLQLEPKIYFFNFFLLQMLVVEDSKYLHHHLQACLFIYLLCFMYSYAFYRAFFNFC